VSGGSGDKPRTAVPGREPRTNGLDTSVAHPARIWDYWLGGKDNFVADRAAGDHVREAAPFIVDVARADRAFLASSVRHLVAGLGIRQFLDIGTGLPTADNTHEVAQAAAPESRVVYVDNDPIVLAHARALLTSTPQGVTAYIDADARDTGTIIAQAASTLDLTRPVAVMLLGILLFIPDEDNPWAITAELMDAVPPGSYLVVSHGASDIKNEDVAAAGSRYNEHSAVQLRLRTRAQFTRFFDGLELAGPGVVPINHWQPAPLEELEQEDALPAYAALGRKPAQPMSAAGQQQPADLARTGTGSITSAPENPANHGQVSTL
jgi:SAM-dependent methyltransferase